MVQRNLPNVTVVVIDRAAHALTCIALLDTLREICPAKVLIFSDEEILPDGDGVEWIRVPPGDRNSAMHLLWRDAPAHVETSHMLHIEWDGWVLDGTCWCNEWLQYDYIGAPWPWHPTLCVGNGGFSLRSKRLFNYINHFPTIYQPIHPEDDTLCRTYRPSLELIGFRWAPLHIAANFSLEHGPDRRTFGFHDCRNWPRVLDTDVLNERISMANNYARSHPSWIF